MAKASDNQFPSILLVEQGSKPTGTAAPGVGEQRLYFKTDHQLYHENNAGTETEIVGGGGLTTVTKTAMRCAVILYDNTLSSAGSWNVTGISQTYDDLELFIRFRGNVAATGVGFDLTFNNDTTDGNYYVEGVEGGLSVVAAINRNNRQVVAGPGSSGTANYYGEVKIFIPEYAGTSANKKGLIQNADLRLSTYMNYDGLVFHWLNTAAINRIAFAARNADITLTGRMRIIGYKNIDVVTDVT